MEHHRGASGVASSLSEGPPDPDRAAVLAAHHAAGGRRACHAEAVSKPQNSTCHTSPPPFCSCRCGLPGSTGADPIWPVLVQGWTLNYEMFFYVLFSLCLFLRSSLRLAAISLTLICCVIAGLFYRGSNALVLSFTDPIFLEFLAGTLLGACLRRGLLPSRGWGYGFMALGVIVLLGCAMTSVTQPRLLAWGIPAVLLVGGALVLETTGRIPQQPWLRLIGDFLLFALSDPRSRHFRTWKIMTRSWAFSVVGTTCRGRRWDLFLIPDGTAGDRLFKTIVRHPAGRSSSFHGATAHQWKNVITSFVSGLGGISHDKTSRPPEGRSLLSRAGFCQAGSAAL